MQVFQRILTWKNRAGFHLCSSMTWRGGEQREGQRLDRGAIARAGREMALLCHDHKIGRLWKATPCENGTWIHTRSQG